MRTSTIPVSAPNWLLIDATGQRIGRLSAYLSHVLKGKHKPTYSPHQLCGDQIVVINARKLDIDQRKLLQKEYFEHSGYLGSASYVRLEKLFAEHPEQVIERTVKGMLKNSRQRSAMLKRLHVFADDVHPYDGQKPQPISLP